MSDLPVKELHQDMIQRQEGSWISLLDDTKTMSAEETKATVYFGYGSNLWKHQMQQRCPTSKFLGIARLNGYKWIINERGYANVVQIESKEDGDEEGKKHDYGEEVWGLVYSLEKKDETNLDRNEGVPRAYTKEWMQVDYWKASTEPDDLACQERKAKKVDMLVYINRKQISEAEPKEEYIYRINMGIKDAVKEGMPEEYVRQVMRRFIPEDEDEVVEGVVEKEVLRFEDESD
ncbi:hypothetical protein LTR86_010459 [Recurvomyces mirabilis]|nr:hypothetical protein LTR86_010459 [Recurvomyces mirabilis]